MLESPDVQERIGVSLLHHIFNGKNRLPPLRDASRKPRAYGRAISLQKRHECCAVATDCAILQITPFIGHCGTSSIAGIDNPSKVTAQWLAFAMRQSCRMDGRTAGIKQNFEFA